MLTLVSHIASGVPRQVAGRHGAVRALLGGSEASYFGCLGVLKRFQDLDLLASSFAYRRPAVVTVGHCRRAIDMVIRLKVTLQLAPQLLAALRPSRLGESLARNPQDEADGGDGGDGGYAGAADPHSSSSSSTGSELLDAICATLADPLFPRVHARIDEVISEGTTWCNSVLGMHSQECFAVKPGTDGLLDVARKTFVETLEPVPNCVVAEPHRITLNPGMPLHVTQLRAHTV